MVKPIPLNMTLPHDWVKQMRHNTKPWLLGGCRRLVSWLKMNKQVTSFEPYTNFGWYPILVLRFCCPTSKQQPTRFQTPMNNQFYRWQTASAADIYFTLYSKGSSNDDISQLISSKYHVRSVQNPVSTLWKSWLVENGIPLSNGLWSFPVSIIPKLIINLSSFINYINYHLVI